MQFSTLLSFYVATLLPTLWLTISLSQPLCQDNERSMLLKFKQTLTIAEFASVKPYAYAKLAFWTGELPCCSWDGVSCDGVTGHIIGLDLSSSLIYGSIGSDCSLFGLARLERLDLSDNHFNYSNIPSSISSLKSLSYINLSSAFFSGKIPLEISELRNLFYLHMSSNLEIGSGKAVLELNSTDFERLIRNLTKLEALSLSFVDIASEFPANLIANFSSSLELLVLESCGLRGKFPVEVFRLPNLQYLNLKSNNLTGELPRFNRSSPLKVLDVAATSISGELPTSIGELSSLIELDTSRCDLSGNVPASIGKLTELKYLFLYENKFQGSIPSSVGNLTKLVELELDTNRFGGLIPLSFSNLKNLQTLTLENNELTGIVNFDMFFSLKNLTVLLLSNNNLTLIIDPRTNQTPPMYTVLKLSFCNLTTFPEFLRQQARMEILNLQGNRITGSIPKWLTSESRETLFNLNLAQNSLTGEVSPEICNLKFLSVLDLSQNKLAGNLPRCLGNFTDSLKVLKLRGNSFSGTIPEFAEGNGLRIIDLSHNRFEGKLPRSLEYCTSLSYLVIENNRLVDVFPHWLGTIPELQILVLRSNSFYGVLEEPSQSDVILFPKLCIIDISYNAFTGKLPSKCIQNWKAMTKLNDEGENLNYMWTKPYEQLLPSKGRYLNVIYHLDVTITIKGVTRFYDEVNVQLSVIDLSNNHFFGKIPGAIGTLKRLHCLNLSNNNFTGRIPSSLGDLSAIESLDLSQNKLSGEIPIELTNLNFLQYFNVSHNRLTGPIPQANQLSRFEGSSYEGNLGLCGIPLPEKCGKPEAVISPKFPRSKPEGPSFVFNFGCGIIALGYTCGFVIGFYVLGNPRL